MATVKIIEVISNKFNVDPVFYEFYPECVVSALSVLHYT
jgi:hypothetical protein